MTKAVYSETLFPAVGTQLALALSYPMVFLAALPFGFEIALTIGLLGGTVTVATMNLLSPKITVTKELTAGRFRLPLGALGEVKILESDKFRRVIGPEANPGAQLMIRGDVPRGVMIYISDPNDPTPYLVLSSRRPAELVAAIDANRA